MQSKCPKCGKKLSIFYIKQTCNECGCDLLNYNREAELEKDAEKAEAEFAMLEKVIGKFKRNKK
ncbi:MAG: hypothetical protein E7538_03795 [Ruminococcaceae bacterium]|nr:hypothetical protein [Oscillospiraceae bacterium]